MDNSDHINSYTKKEKRFLTISFLTICSLFLLILAGGIVRSSGSGMGCPDWPKCFDRWVPPTNVSELPADYNEIYKHRGYENTEFNALKTWTEYVNRLLGALTGLLIILSAYFSFFLYKENRKVFWISVLSVLLVGFQGWLGGKVVETNLKVWIITIHMVLALIILGLVIYTYIMVKYKSLEYLELSLKGYTIAKCLIWLCLIFTAVQVISGTQVREMIDEVSVAMNGQNRTSWIEQIDSVFIFHRSFSWLVFLSNVVLFLFIRKVFVQSELLKRIVSWNLIFVILQLITGLVLAYLNLPPVFQTLHLWLATFLSASQFLLLILINMYAKNDSLRLINKIV
jgi:heme a synthase